MKIVKQYCWKILSKNFLFWLILIKFCKLFKNSLKFTLVLPQKLGKKYEKEEVLLKKVGRTIFH